MYNCSAIEFTLDAKSLFLHVSSVGLGEEPNKSSKYSLWEFLLSISNRMPYKVAVSATDRTLLSH